MHRDKQELQAVARHQLARRRRRLGELTPEQERALEALLISIVNEISHPLIELARAVGEREEMLYPIESTEHADDELIVCSAAD